ncbi:CrcB family protein [Woeseiaceae bacterium]|jgi:fluoride exporter|nr:CrcB family protein [Woeseiaceae bacterium]MDB2544495.1 CrcB family protein [Woeseiaceae bacterium]
MLVSFNSFILVGLGGALGAMSRYGLTVISNYYNAITITGTILSNTIGCFLMGVIFQYILNLSLEPTNNILIEQNRLLFTVGFCGSFTTLSALILEMHKFREVEEYFQAFIYLFGTLLAAFLCFYLGVMLVDYLIKNR